MKKMIFGMMLFISGFMGMMTFVVLAVFHPWSYNGITGMRGFLLGSDTETYFILTMVTLLVGLFICINEAYDLVGFIEDIKTYLIKPKEDKIQVKEES